MMALTASLVGAATLATQAAADGRPHERLYRVTVQNATRGQPIAPSLFITHTAGFKLFSIGDAPTLGIATMAETGDPGLLSDDVVASDGVYEAVILPYDRTPPVMLPGESNSTMISASGRARFFTAVAMLGATNDAFYAIQGIPLPRFGSITVRADAYDAGSEANTEANGEVPATPLGNQDSVMGGDGEGHIHIHAGIHGVGGADGLVPAMHDWRNPVVEITIERIHHN
jgi:hypothetical protein